MRRVTNYLQKSEFILSVWIIVSHTLHWFAIYDVSRKTDRQAELREHDCKTITLYSDVYYDSLETHANKIAWNHPLLI